VGGIKEKVLAARRAGVHKIVLPSQNKRDLDAVQQEILDDLLIIFVDTMDEVLEAVFPHWQGKLFTTRRESGKEQSNPRATMLDMAGAARSLQDH
jgi:ATP-dependent Lon protease